MSEDKKTEKTEQKKEETSRGDRGELGTATAGLTIRQRYHAQYFRRESANDKHNSNRHIFVKFEGAPSLKQFARTLLKEGDPVAKEWFANKRGAKNQKRSEANAKAARESGAATKAKRRADATKKK